MAGPEKLFEQKVRKEIKKRGGWSVKFFANAFTPRGIPDLLCCINGWFVALEVKSQKGSTTEEQEKQMSLIRESGGLAMKLGPQQWEAFLDLLDTLEASG